MTPLPPSSHSFQVVRGLERIAFLSFAVYLALLLGTNSVAESGGVLTWFPLWRWPTAANQWAAIGAISLLPPLSITAWLGARLRARRRGLRWGWGRMTWPLAGLMTLGGVSMLLNCLGRGCDGASVIRLLLVALHLAWIYLYVVNEKADVFWIVVSVITFQSVVAVGQFTGQSDLGLSLLGESRLDPLVSGVSVVMRGPERWLRAYGFAVHPNVLAGTLVTMLLLLILLMGRVAGPRRWAAAAVFLLGLAAMLTTLSRWAFVCLLVGLAINILPLLRQTKRRRRPALSPLAAATTGAALLITLLFLGLYGDAVTGRAVNLDTPVESRSLWERERDTSISLKVVKANPLSGVGIGNYVVTARAYDAWAETVHVMPLLLAAELGLGGALVWLWLLLAPVLRRGALDEFAPETGLWLGFWLLGLLYPAPYPLYELRSALLTGLVAATIALSGIRAGTDNREAQPGPGFACP